MGKKGGNDQQHAADKMYQQQADQSNQYFQQWMTQFYPELQKLMPIYQGALDGSNSTLMNAAEAPVNVNTARMINTVDSNPGMATNKNAALQDIAFSGQQQAGLAADQTIAMAASALQNLLGIGSGNAQTGTSNLGSAAGGEANLGAQISNQDNAWWQSVLGAAGTAYGLNSPGAKQQTNFSAGGGGGGGTAGSEFGKSGFSFSPIMPMSASSPAAGMNPFTALSGGTNVSSPISQLKMGSYVPPEYTGGG